MQNTGRHLLPLILPQQAQKHVTHNEALNLIDGLLFPVISGFGLNTPPALPDLNSIWFTGANPTDDWYDKPGQLAFNTAAGWRFCVPVKGIVALDQTMSRMVLFDGAAWSALGTFIDFGNLAQLGINTAADTVNRFAVRGNAALMTAQTSADGGSGDFQLKINKEDVADTGALLFQTGWSGRAEIGLSGDDSLRIKVSSDGNTWVNAISISAANGSVTLAPNSVANVSLADMPSGRIKGRSSQGSGSVEDLTGDQVAGLLPVFSPSAAGLVPQAGSNTGLYLRGDGQWSEPSPSSGPARFFSFNDCVTVTSSQDWSFTVSGTGAAHTNASFGVANSIGAVTGALGTTATGRCSITSGAYTYFLLGQWEARFKTRIRIASLSDATNTWSLRAGFLDSITAESTDGVFFRYTHSVAGGNFQAVCRSNGVETALDTLQAVSTAATYQLEALVAPDATSVQFRINGTLVGTISTNIPASAGRELGYGIMALRSAGTAAVSAYLVDYLLVDAKFNTSR